MLKTLVILGVLPYSKKKSGVKMFKYQSNNLAVKTLFREGDIPWILKVIA